MTCLCSSVVSSVLIFMLNSAAASVSRCKLMFLVTARSTQQSEIYSSPLIRVSITANIGCYGKKQVIQYCGQYIISKYL